MNKLFIITTEGFVYGFNRYMVECEFCELKICINEKVVLIDTWWNVNVEQPREDITIFVRF